jgi:hypothetical protein
MMIAMAVLLSAAIIWILCISKTSPAKPSSELMRWVQRNDAMGVPEPKSGESNAHEGSSSDIGPVQDLVTNIPSMYSFQSMSNDTEIPQMADDLAMPLAMPLAIPQLRRSLSEQREAMYNRPVEASNMQEYIVYPRVHFRSDKDSISN